ncbi:MAG: glycoside hydrolase family 13 protein, partial [Anaerolineales bacterium]|nr:glycoside hydrolase family 13 protein [Anaerolineales bacterium]
RFARSLRLQHPRGIQFKPWGSPPQEQGYQGGDLLGIVDHLDYLKDLGVNALYLNPIFSSASNHRYHAYDYFEVDPLLGGNAALRELLDAAHARGIRIVLDGVFNHASRGFWAFHHILENGPTSPYLDWFLVRDWPLRPYSNGPGLPANYDAWANMPALPKFNTNNPGVRDYLFEVARYWIDFGIDGWRLDVPGDIDDDAFWQEFRRIVKTANPEAYICGEIWHEARRWLQGDQFDAVMNYIFTWNALAFCGSEMLRQDWYHEHLPLQPLTANQFASNIEQMYNLYDWEINYAQMNLLDSHDMPRALYLMGEDKSALRLSAILQMTLPGAPCIYYGDEIGLSSAGDPYCRQAFPWQAEQQWDWELLSFYRDITALRHAHPVLRTGSLRFLHARDHVLVYQRQLDDGRAFIILNTARQMLKIQLPLDPALATLKQAWPGGEQQSWSLQQGILDVEIKPRSALVLVS